MNIIAKFDVGTGEKERVNPVPIAICNEKASAPRLSVAEQVNLLFERKMQSYYSSDNDDYDEDDFEFIDDPYEIEGIEYDDDATNEDQRQQDAASSLGGLASRAAGSSEETTSNKDTGESAASEAKAAAPISD